jgi:hypothetical protein
LECAPLKVSGSIPPGVNFGELVHTKLKKLALNGPPKWVVGLVPSD